MTNSEKPAPSGAPVEQAFFETAPHTDDAAVQGRMGQVAHAFRKLLPWALRFLGALLLVFFVYAGPWPLTQADTPEFVEEARRQGAALGKELGGAAPGPLHAAVGAYNITPNPPFFVRLAGYSGIRKSTGLEGSLQAFAWALKAGGGPACVVMGADILINTPELTTTVATEIDALGHVPRDRILFTASHTHSSLGGFGRTMAESMVLGASEDGLDTLALRWSPVAWSVLEDMQPARLHAGQPTAAQLVENRTVAGGVADTTVDVIQLDVDKEDTALLVLFGAHPTTESRLTMMTPDYPGPMRRVVGEHVGAFVSFAAGAVGSMGARVPYGPRTPEQMGALLATPVMDAMLPRRRGERVEPETMRVSCGRARLPLPPPRVPVGLRLALTERASTVIMDPPAEYGVSVLLAGPMLLVSMPGELSGELTPALRERAKAHGYALSVASFSGEYAGYLLPADRDGLGPERHAQFSGSGAAAPAVAFVEALVDALPQGPIPVGTSLARVWPR